MFYTVQTNLHDCWDTRMIEKWQPTVDGALAVLQSIIAANATMVQYYEANMDPMDMASESFDYVLSTVYNYTSKNGMPYIGDAYYNRNLPIIQSRLIGGGVRLAKYLNGILDSSYKTNPNINNVQQQQQPEQPISISAKQGKELLMKLFRNVPNKKVSIV